MESPSSNATTSSLGAESRASATVATCAATVAIMLLFVLARMFAKAFVVKILASEDCRLAKPLLITQLTPLADFCIVASVGSVPWQYGSLLKEAKFLSLGYFGLVLHCEYTRQSSRSLARCLDVCR